MTGEDAPAAGDDPWRLRRFIGSPDDVKLRSCATLFAAAAPGVRVFEQLLTRKFTGQHDARTLALLADDARQ